MAAVLQLGAVTVDVIWKDIRNVHLTVHPPSGKVRISAPLRMSIESVRLFAISKLAWIKQQQRRVLEQERETPREYIDRESHYVWGRRYLLKVVEQDAPPRIDLKHRTMVLSVRPGMPAQRRQRVLDEWYRAQMRLAIPPIIKRWEPLLGVQVDRVFIQRMKTKWGSCSRTSASIRLNSELAKKPLECLEYVIVHEMAHLLEPTHSERFFDRMNALIPNWRYYRDLLNRLPVRHENWQY